MFMSNIEDLTEICNTTTATAIADNDNNQANISSMITDITKILMFHLYKDSLLEGLQAAYTKLKKYYSRTDDSNVYSIAVAMDPTLRYNYWIKEGWNMIEDIDGINYFENAKKMEWRDNFKGLVLENEVHEAPADDETPRK